nr:hypothetical protein [Tanacetum cinerariifolium]
MKALGISIFLAAPAGVRELDNHSSSEADPSERSLPLVSVAPMVSPFLCLDDSESNTEMPKRHVSSKPHDAMLDIPIGRLYHTYPGGPCRDLTMMKSVRPIPSHRLELRYTSHHLDHFAFRSSSDHSSSDHSSSGHSTSDHSSAGHSTSDHSSSGHSTSDFYPPLARTLHYSEAYHLWRFALLSTMYPPTTSESSAGDSSFESSARPFARDDSVKEDIDADVLADIEADATTVVVAADMDVKVGVNVGIGMEVDVRVDVVYEVEGELESSDRGTMKVGVDVVDGIDILVGMLMPDAVGHSNQVEEVVQDIYGHIIEIPLQRVEDIEKGHRGLEARSLIASR